MPKNDNLQRFVKSSCLVLIMIFLLDFLIGFILQELNRKQKSGLLYRTNYAIDSTTQDVLVFGSSRANHHYDPQVFEKKLNLSFYNCGRDGTGLIYSSALIHAVVNRYRPTYVLLDLHPNELEESEESIAPLLPYHQNPSIYPFIKNHLDFADVKLLSKIYPYNSSLTTLLMGATDLNQKRAEDDNGYLRLDGVLKEKYREFDGRENHLSSSRIRTFEELLRFLESKKIQTYVIISPCYGKINNNQTALKSAAICRKFKQVKFVNYLNTAISLTPDYFVDLKHLNGTGAFVFSQHLAEVIEN